MNDQPKIKALAPWFGGKRTLAPVIIAELGKHSAYWEPFCGSCAVLMAKGAAAMETVNDLHGDLVNLARVVASDHYAELAERLGRTYMADELFTESKTVLAGTEPFAPAPSVGAVDAGHVERAYWYMINSWQGRNGVSGTSQTNITVATRYTSNGGSGGFRWRSAVDSVPAWHSRLKAVHIKNMDGVTMLERIEDSSRSAIYVDPPYLVKSNKYIHDLTTEDHQRLASVLQRFTQTRVVVSYYDDPRLADLYPSDKWTKRDVAFRKGLSNTSLNRKGAVSKAPEVLLINGPSYAKTRDESSLFEPSPVASCHLPVARATKRSST